MKPIGDRGVRDPSHEAFSELDALVLAEIEALELDNPVPCQTGEPGPEQEPAGDNVIFKDEWVPERITEDQLSDDTALPVEPSLAESELEPEDAAADLTFDPTADRGETDLFTLQEQTFINRTIQWLKERDNKDMIMSRIWALVTESEPTSFFSVEEVSAEPDQERDEQPGEEKESGVEDEDGLQE